MRDPFWRLVCVHKTSKTKTYATHSSDEDLRRAIRLHAKAGDLERAFLHLVRPLGDGWGTEEVLLSYQFGSNGKEVEKASSCSVTSTATPPAPTSRNSRSGSRARSRGVPASAVVRATSPPIN